jgi:hypothetical protein
MPVLELEINLNNITYSERQSLILKELNNDIDDLIESFDSISVSTASNTCVINQCGYAIIDITRDIYGNNTVIISNEHDSTMKCRLTSGNISGISKITPIIFKEYALICDNFYRILIETI